MKTIFKDPSYDLTEMAEAVRKQAGTRERYLQEIDSLKNFIAPDSLGNDLCFNAAGLMDEEGTRYSTVHFIVQGFSEIAGETWISGNEFRLNLTEYLEQARQHAVNFFPEV